jgi:hypothetical protein
MRRPVDRIQTVVALGLLALFLIVATLLAGLTTSRAYDSGLRAERQEHATHRPVMATVVATNDLSSDDSDRGLHPVALLRWRANDGTLRSGGTPKRQGDRVGSQRQIWIDVAGNLTRRPRAHGQTIADASLVGTASLTVVAIPCFLLYVAVRHRLDRRRFDQWTADWARTAPLWTRRSS